MDKCSQKILANRAAWRPDWFCRARRNDAFVRERQTVERLIPRARGLVLHPLATEAKDLPTRNRTHQPLPFVQTPAKAQIAGCVETQPRVHFAALSAFCVVGVPILAA